MSAEAPGGAIPLVPLAPLAPVAPPSPGPAADAAPGAAPSPEPAVATAPRVAPSPEPGDTTSSEAPSPATDGDGGGPEVAAAEAIDLVPLVPLAPDPAEPPTDEPDLPPSPSPPPEQGPPVTVAASTPEPARELAAAAAPPPPTSAGGPGTPPAAAIQREEAPPPPTERLVAVGPCVGVLLPLGGIGGDVTWTIGAEVRFLIPGLDEMLAIGLGGGYYPIHTTGTEGQVEYELDTWVAPLTVSATFAPLRAAIVSPVLGAGAGAYLGETSWRSEHGSRRDSGITAAFGFFVLAGLELDLGRGGGLLLEGRYARAVGDLGDVVENADLGGLGFDLRYRFLF